MNARVAAIVPCIFALLPASSMAAVVMAAGSVSGVGGSATTVNYGTTFSSAPLVFTLLDDANGDPTISRISNVGTSSFDVRQVESPAADGSIATNDTIQWLAIEPGTHTLPGGLTIVAGSINTLQFQGSSGTGWASIDYSSGSFGSVPGVLLEIQSDNNGGLGSSPASPFLAHTLDESTITTTTADIALETLALTVKPTVAETIAFLAFTPGVEGTLALQGGGTVDFQAIRAVPATIHGWDDSASGIEVPFLSSFSGTPIVVATDMSRNGGDGGWIRQRSADADGVFLAIDEETQGDAERGHLGLETAAILAFESSFGDTIVPEPSTIALAVLGILSLGLIVWRRKRS